MAVVHADRAAQFTDLRLRPRTRTTIDIPWDPLSIAKAGHKHFLAKEIHEQPTTLASVIRPRITLDPIELRFPSFRLPMPAAEIERVVLVGSGTAWHAGLIGRDYIEDFAGLPATCEIASEFAYRASPLSPRTLVVAITQSGETADVLAAIGRAKRGGATVVGIVNAVGSEATRQADAVMYMHAGPEVSVAATKTFTSQLASLHLLACQLGVARGVLTQEELRHHLAALAHVPEHVERALTCEPQIEALARRFHRFRDFLYIGRGQAFPLALEGALKLKEISYIHAEGYAAGELKHGPIALAAVRRAGGRRGHCGSPAGQDAQCRGASAGARRPGDPDCHGGRRAGGRNGRRGGVRPQDSGSGGADRHRDPAPVAGLSRGRMAGSGHRPAAQSRQVRDGGVVAVGIALDRLA